MYQSFLIKYAEIAIKGKNRHLFEDALVSQICHALREVDGEFNVRKEQGRIYVEAESEFDYEETVEALQHVFGIVGICPVIMAQDEGFDALAQMVVAHVKEVYGDKSLTFKVLSDDFHGDQCRVRRQDFRRVSEYECGCP